MAEDPTVERTDILPAPQGDRGFPVHTVDLGTAVVVYFVDGSYEVLPKSRFPSQAGDSPDPDLGRKQAFQAQQNQLQLGESQRQFNEQFGFDKAAFNAKQQLSEAQYNWQQAIDARDYDAANFWKQRTDELSRLQFGEGQRQFDVGNALDFYKHLSNVASNPRNFMQQFFTLRGQQAPPGSEAFANSPGISAAQPLERFLPDFLRLVGDTRPTPQSVGTLPQSLFSMVRTSPAAPQAAVPVAPESPNTGSLTNVSGIPLQRATTPEGVTQYQTGSGGVLPTDASLALVDDTPISLAGGVSVDDFKKRLAPYARGGVIPEPVLGRGMVSGRPYTFGEQGPEGVVPTDFLPDFLRRRGGRSGSYAIGGVIGYGDDLYGGGDYLTDPGAYIDPGSTSGGTPTFTKTSGGLAYPTITDPYSSGGYSVPTSSSGAPAPAPMIPQAGTTQETAPTGYMTPEMEDYINTQIELTRLRNLQQQAPTAPAPAPNYDQPSPTYTAPPLAPETTAPAGTPRPAITPAPLAPLPTVSPLPIQQPTALPVGGPNGPITSPEPVPGALMPRDVAAPGTFGGTVPNARPRFLPGEDMSPIAALFSQGALPPFIARVLAQAQGIQSQGTNQPQRFNLPPDLPLVSKLGYLQMTPSERAAFQSIISASGLDPEDYFAYVESVSPQGGSAPWSPLFGSRFTFTRQ